MDDCKDMILRLADKGRKADDIATELGLKLSYVRRIGRGHFRGRERYITDTLKQKIVQMASSGLTRGVVADRLDLPKSVVSRYGKGHFHIGRGAKGSLEPEKVERIVEMLERGDSVTEIARALGISKSTVSKYGNQCVKRNGKKRKRTLWNGYKIKAAKRPLTRYVFIKDDGTPDAKLQKNFEEMWDLKERELVLLELSEEERVGGAE